MFSRMTVAQLKNVLKAGKLPQNGTTPVLMERLAMHISRVGSSSQQGSRTSSSQQGSQSSSSIIEKQ